MKEIYKLRVCLAASAGGHLSQLLKIGDSSRGYYRFCVTTSEVVRERLREYNKVYVVGECNHQHPIRTFLVLLRCMYIILRERPDVVISTGAACGCMVCFLGKVIGAKVKNQR